MEVVVTVGAIGHAKLQSTNQHPIFYRPDALPVAQPTVSEHGREVNWHCTVKIIGKEFQTNCYKTIFRKINTEEIFFQLTLITNKDYFSRKKALYCRGICDLYLWS